MLVTMSAMLLTAAPVHVTAAPISLPGDAASAARPGAVLSPFASDFPAAASIAVSPLALAASLPAIEILPLGLPTQDIPPVGPAPLGTPAQRTSNDIPKDIVVTGRKETAGDPLRAVNAESFAVTQKVDDAVIGPVARTYKNNVPSPIRRGIHNFLYNLREPIVFLNFLLQFKPGKAAETVGRFAINTTIGVAGVLDMAKRKPFHLPRRSNGFANTLGYYGVKNGPFLFLPIVGPTTIRDLLGGAVDRLILPVGVGHPFTSTSYTVPAGILGALDHRSEFDQTLKDLHDNSPDPYAATRSFYLNRRQAEIDHLHGRVEGDPAGMSGPPPSVVPFVPSDLEPGAKPVSEVPAESSSAPAVAEPGVAAPAVDAKTEAEIRP
ncbi:VacJ family lipoprotein [Sphingomonas sp. PP-CC-3A-396]|uniref:MlaA family lipoprotein n=1 Tax=Sphingomonas sp. PP-CC-3A-396 TaxID=2135655 RepID=UPI0010F1EAE0|nr:VacJ family lipoprotein [Sphingomonas sp. PP-CC-3A-396]TCQ05660.1 phospholipid-binding lipoprotein MlaA [Sphingomonas sp. PP-CC-3A-396]